MMLNVLKVGSSFCMLGFAVAYINYYLPRKHQKYGIAVMIADFGYLLVVCTLQIFGIVDIYERGLVPTLIMYFLMLCVCLIFLWDAFHKELRDQRVIIIMLPAVTGGLLDLIEFIRGSQNTMTWVRYGIMIMVLLQIYIFLKKLDEGIKEREQAQNLKNELIQNKLLIMQSQIKPHFLFNSLTAIEHLCIEYPQKAQRALELFAAYLRGNLNELENTNCIPIQVELKHVENYMELEKLRFEEKLQVIYQIENIDFMLPALTIQPLAENAVKHGVGQKKEGGMVFILVDQTDSDYRVQITDDGVGFDVFAKG